ncbi:TRF5 [Hepatospora eriocheir]|uniref:polynucleotide adenylyltransferase n=1 Tax=Hepatospora eriocheir TaxID=1081669 RepID=A0A1X0QD98_9MICR|nr:TRF5 [Hepatospora eriocheir]
MVFSSDIDITIITPLIKSKSSSFLEKIGRHSSINNKQEINELLKKITNIITKYDIAKNGHVIHAKNAKVPILRMVDKRFNIKIDICVGQEVGMKAGDFIKKKCKEHDGLDHMILIFKYFMKKRRLSDGMNGGLVGYAQFILLLDFFQTHPMIQTNRISVKENLGVLFMDFFQYYSRFPFEGAIIDTNKRKYIYNNTSKTCIRDPIYEDILTNTAGSCQSIGLIKECFYFSYRIMCGAINEKSQSKCLSDLWIRHDQFEKHLRNEMIKKYEKLFDKN